MWKQLLTLLQTVFTLARDIEETRTEMKNLREEVNKLTSVVVALKGQIDVIDQREIGEREKLALQLDNEFLKRDAVPKKLPPSSKAKKKRGDT
jgi:septal ring factor EnvC (AmiA/AmiB activator)